MATKSRRPYEQISASRSIVAATAVLLASVFASATSAEPIRYQSANGSELVLNLADGIWRGPSGVEEKLADCGDESQTCFSNGRDFGFSFPSDCRDFLIWPSRVEQRQKFRPRIGSVLHGHIWIVFLDYPKYLFEYVEPRGITAIYMKTDASPDFGELLKKHDDRWNLGDFEVYAFRHSGVGLAACK